MYVFPGNPDVRGAQELLHGEMALRGQIMLDVTRTFVHLQSLLELIFQAEVKIVFLFHDKFSVTRCCLAVRTKYLEV